MTPQFREYEGDTPASFTWSMNGERRHLTASQRAALAVELLPHLEEEARKRKESTQFGESALVVAEIPQPEKGPARDKAAQITGASGRYVSDHPPVFVP